MNLHASTHTLVWITFRKRNSSQSRMRIMSTQCEWDLCLFSVLLLCNSISHFPCYFFCLSKVLKFEIWQPVMHSDSISSCEHFCVQLVPRAKFSNSGKMQKALTKFYLGERQEIFSVHLNKRLISIFLYNKQQDTTKVSR